MFLRQLFFSCIFLPVTLRAFEIPKGLTVDDRREIVRTLGHNSAPKVLSNPYPLGGYAGFEMGISMEVINIRDIRKLGCEPGSLGCGNQTLLEETEWKFPRLTVGKGLYNNVDLFFSFIPPTSATNASDYGAQVRWSFYQAQFLPVNLSLVGYMNQLNFGDLFLNRNMGLELITGVNVNNFALYFGGGWLEGMGTFISGTSANCEDCTIDVDDPDVESISKTATQRVESTHTVVGFSLHYENIFAAAQVDRYRDPVYSAKVGLRF